MLLLEGGSRRGGREARGGRLMHASLSAFTPRTPLTLEKANAIRALLPPPPPHQLSHCCPCTTVPPHPQAPTAAWDPTGLLPALMLTVSLFAKYLSFWLRQDSHLKEETTRFLSLPFSVTPATLLQGARRDSQSPDRPFSSLTSSPPELTNPPARQLPVTRWRCWRHLRTTRSHSTKEPHPCAGTQPALRKPPARLWPLLSEELGCSEGWQPRLGCAGLPPAAERSHRPRRRAGLSRHRAAHNSGALARTESAEPPLRSF